MQLLGVEVGQRLSQCLQGHLTGAVEGFVQHPAPNLFAFKCEPSPQHAKGIAVGGFLRLQGRAQERVQHVFDLGATLAVGFELRQEPFAFFGDGRRPQFKDALQNGNFGAKVVVQRGAVDPGIGGDFTQAHPIDATFTEQTLGRFQNAVLGAQFGFCKRGAFGHADSSVCVDMILNFAARPAMDENQSCGTFNHVIKSHVLILGVPQP